MLTETTESSCLDVPLPYKTLMIYLLVLFINSLLSITLLLDGWIRMGWSTGKIIHLALAPSGIPPLQTLPVNTHWKLSGTTAAPCSSTLPYRHGTILVNINLDNSVQQSPHKFRRPEWWFIYFLHWKKDKQRKGKERNTHNPITLKPL